MSGSASSVDDSVDDSDDEEMLETVARSRQLTKGITTNIADVTTTVAFEPPSTTNVGRLASGRGVEALAEPFSYDEQDSDVPAVTLDHLQLTLSSEYAGKAVSLFNRGDFNVFSHDDFDTVMDGRAIGDVVMLFDMAENKGPLAYLCRTFLVTLVRVPDDGLGKPQTLVRYHGSKHEQEQFAETVRAIGSDIVLTHEDGQYAAKSVDSEGDSWLSSLRSVFGVDETVVKLGQPRDEETLMGSTLSSTDIGRSEDDNMRETDWTTVRFEEGDDIVARAADDDRQWTFETTGGVLDDPDDVAFFEQAGFGTMEDKTATLKTIPVNAPPEEDTWKLNAKGDWWLCPETL